MVGIEDRDVKYFQIGDCILWTNQVAKARLSAGACMVERHCALAIWARTSNAILQLMIETLCKTVQTQHKQELRQFQVVPAGSVIMIVQWFTAEQLAQALRRLSNASLKWVS